MSKQQPKITLPFANFDDQPVQKTKWPNWVAGSRLWNRALLLSAAICTLILFTFATRRLLNSSYNPEASTSLLELIPSIQVKSHYGGAEITHPDLNHLIIVAGHAIWLGGSKYKKDIDWVLEPHQYGQTGTFVAHIRQGAKLAAESPKSLLIFSGGETRYAAGARSESQSYTALFQLLEQEDPILGSLDRVTTEEFARDSFENLLFSIARFYEVTGRYPDKISVVGFLFKQERYSDIHCKAIKFPKSKFTYHGIDPDGLDGEDLSGESTNAKLLFQKDLYGCKNKVLVNKKKGRNPGRRRHGYEITNPQLAELMNYCPADGATVYPGRLPWQD